MLCIIQIPHSPRQTRPFRGQNVPTPEKVEKGPFFSFFIQNAPIDVKLAGGGRAWGMGRGFLLLLPGAPNDSLFLNTSEEYQMVYYKR